MSFFKKISDAGIHTSKYTAVLKCMDGGKGELELLNKEGRSTR